MGQRVLLGIAIVFLLNATSCDNQEKGDEFVTPNTDNVVNVETNENRNISIGDYAYPTNPAQQLKSALESDANNKNLPIKISDVENVAFGGQQCTQIKIDFTNNSKNTCIITFVNTNMYGYSEALDGFDNPSFTISFQDPDNSQDMLTILTSVLKYLSPELSFEEAEALAIKQDETISTDGYAMPQDVGGYQVQAQYSNPHTFFQTSDFEAKFGVRVSALKQLWGTIDGGKCKELITLQDYDLLEKKYWDQKVDPEFVYADFVVKNVWKEQSYIHGETWDTVDLEAMDGQRYIVTLNTWDYPHTYEFGIGQKYTIYIRLNFHEGIVYAIQRSESAQRNSRGEAQPIDYPVTDWKNPTSRIEPSARGTISNVYFILESQMVGGEPYAALEGQGVGKEQWPKDPIRENYRFVGWYDDIYRGNPYTPDTNIYQDTELYAKWKYDGTGGAWPRAHRGNIEVTKDEKNTISGQEWLITACGYNMDIEKPKDQRFRWIPLNWALSNGTRGRFSTEAPFQARIPIEHKDEQKLFVTYSEEVFDGVEWQKTGQQHEVEEKTLSIDPPYGR